jgi:TetR/AcrR family transcriptional regulator, transcriptional repressor for nem operon
MSKRSQGAAVAVERAPGKRERLVRAAKDLLYEQGVERTTLAEVAARADVPPGNVYYYFKTKDDLVEAAIASQREDVQSTLAALDTHRTPKARLRALVRVFIEQRDQVAQSGCPQGSLCSELDKRGDRLSDACGELLRIPISWAERQFEEMGRRDARELAVALIAGYQGAALLANTFRDPGLLAGEGKRLERWIDGLS